MAGKFIKSAITTEDWPDSTMIEVGIVGRSNAGKSTIINVIAGHKGLARTSSSPGKTDILNFFEIDKKFVLVDMPGYGYAARGQTARDSWTPMIENYLKNRTNLKGVILVMDIQRDWSEDEINLVNWVAQNDLKVILALNKMDKLNQKELAARKKEFKNIHSVDDIVITSTKHKETIELLLRSVFDNILRT